MTDPVEHLVPQLARGDEDAFRALVRTLGEALFAFAVSRTRDSARAQDVVQTAFIRVYRQRANLQHGTLRAYCYRIVENLTRDSARDAALRSAREREAASMRPETITSDPQRAALAREAWQAALGLPGELRDVVLLHHGQGLSLAEAGAALDIPKGTVQTRLQRALDSLREKLGASPALGVLPLGELLGQHSGFAAPVAAPPSFILNVETAVMATIAQKSAVSVTAIILALLLLGGGIGGFIVLSQAPRPQSNQLASEPETPSRPQPPPTVDHKDAAPTANAAKIDTSTPATITKVEAQPVVTPTPVVEHTKPVEAKNPRGRDNIDYAQYTIRVKGRAIDPDGNPVTMADTRVHSQEGGPADSPGPLLATGGSDANGNFDISANLKDYIHYKGEAEIRYLRVYIVMTHATLLFGCTEACPEFNPQQREYLCDNLLIKFTRPITARITVLDDAGAPVPGATVGWGDGRYRTVRRTPDGAELLGKSDSAGVVQFVLPVMESDSVIQLHVHGFRTVFAYAEGYLGACADVRAEPNKSNAPFECTLKLRKGCEVSGVVEDEARVPVANASFYFETHTHDGWFVGTQPGILVQADAQGRFRTMMAPGEHEFEIEAKGFVVRPVKFKAPTDALRILMLRLHKVSLVVVDEAGPCRLWRYELFVKGRPDSLGYRQTSGMFERFEHDGLPARSFTVKASMEGWDQPCEFNFDVPASGDLKGEVRVNRPAGMVSVRGRVLGPNGAGIADAEIKLADVGEPLDEFDSSDKGDTRALTRDDGTFTLSAVRPGKRVLRVRDWKHPLLVQEVEFKEGAEFTLQMEATGRLVVKVPATPDHGKLYYQVVVVNAQGRQETDFRTVNGLPHVFEDLPPGRTRVRLETPSFTTLPYDGDPLEKWVEIIAGQTAELVFDSGPTVAVHGTVTIGGKVPKDTNVGIYRLAPGTELNPRGQFTYSSDKSLALDEAGCFEAEGLEPGEYWLRVTVFVPNQRHIVARFTVGEAKTQRITIDVPER